MLLFLIPQKITLHQRIIQQLQSDSKISENINNVSLEKMSTKEEANEARPLSKDNLFDNLLSICRLFSLIKVNTPHTLRECGENPYLNSLCYNIADPPQPVSRGKRLFSPPITLGDLPLAKYSLQTCIFNSFQDVPKKHWTSSFSLTDQEV